ncbi:hypothetical protein GCM10011515_10670 [Tsuneonella deserti]|uniref:DUF1178 family protein n=1 Tax=Tsuneonella deserti TaxID=2035528 RepID=A0ABQ1S6T9_9SPHN|nr:DUF1178 family protein [Tsuneonella deserti]GGD92832.1 hypothetical protein GCM10011515_10670 [Tsuneonella deserti]
MIVFDLTCPQGHRSEAWFASSAAFAEQKKRGLVACPHCGSAEMEKAPMAPAVPAKGNARRDVPPTQPMSNAIPPALRQAMAALAKAQAAALQESTWVGERFAEESRAMHYGERDAATIHGQATPDEAAALVEEGIAVVPLPFPVAPPDELN